MYTNANNTSAVSVPVHITSDQTDEAILILAWTAHSFSMLVIYIYEWIAHDMAISGVDYPDHIIVMYLPNCRLAGGCVPSNTQSLDGKNIITIT